ncbi:MAG: transposase [Planctomycetota bacterium]
MEGRPRFDTRMMLKILIWAYANSARASRKIAKKVQTDVEFM